MNFQVSDIDQTGRLLPAAALICKKEGLKFGTVSHKKRPSRFSQDNWSKIANTNLRDKPADIITPKYSQSHVVPLGGK